VSDGKRLLAGFLALWSLSGQGLWFELKFCLHFSLLGQGMRGSMCVLLHESCLDDIACSARPHKPQGRRSLSAYRMSVMQ